VVGFCEHIDEVFLDLGAAIFSVSSMLSVVWFLYKDVTNRHSELSFHDAVYSANCLIHLSLNIVLRA
jgi:hypothetical protein